MYKRMIVALLSLPSVAFSEQNKCIQEENNYRLNFSTSAIAGRFAAAFECATKDISPCPPEIVNSNIAAAVFGHARDYPAASSHPVCRKIREYCIDFCKEEGFAEEIFCYEGCLHYTK